MTKLAYFLILLGPLLLLACTEDDEQATGDIMVRLSSELSFEINQLELGFYSFANAQGYGQLSNGEVSGYQSFTEAGTCDLYLSGREATTGDPHEYITSCRCLCPLGPGKYTVLLRNNGGDSGVFVDIIPD